MAWCRQLSAWGATIWFCINLRLPVQKTFLSGPSPLAHNVMQNYSSHEYCGCTVYPRSLRYDKWSHCNSGYQLVKDRILGKANMTPSKAFGILDRSRPTTCLPGAYIFQHPLGGWVYCPGWELLFHYAIAACHYSGGACCSEWTPWFRSPEWPWALPHSIHSPFCDWRLWFPQNSWTSQAFYFSRLVVEVSPLRTFRTLCGEE